MLLRFVPLITGLLPIIAIHLSLLLAISAGKIPACIPYLDGCTSISATGRYVPASFLFKPAMIVEAVFMIAYWVLSVAWLNSLYAAASHAARSGKLVVGLGSAGAIFLMVYVTFLGTQEPFYEFMRRFGVYLYFAFSIIAQIILVVRVRSVSRILGLNTVSRIASWQIGLTIVPFALGVLNLILKATMDDADSAENIIEWIFALLMHVYFVLTYFAWKETAFTAKYSISA